jgi:hypothetical protein
MRIRYCHLRPDMIDQVAVIAQKLLPTGYQYDSAKYYELLALAEIKGHNWSIAAFDGDRLVGYILAISAESRVMAGGTTIHLMEFAALFKHRRQVVPQLLRWLAMRAMLTGHSLEADMRQKTAFRTLLRLAPTFRAAAIRVCWLDGRTIVDGERSIFMRLEWLLLRITLIRQISKLFAVAYCVWRMLYSLPRRIVRHLCYKWPPTAVPKRIRAVSYLLTPDEVAHQVENSVLQHVRKRISDV